MKNLRNQMITLIFVTKRLQMNIRRDVFQAIADPNRRAIINLVSKGNLTHNGIAAHFDISRPAISKHIKILTECGLITVKQYGRERICEAQLEKLNEISYWVDQYSKFWTTKFDALEIYLKEIQSKTIEGKGTRLNNKKKIQHGKKKK